MNDAMRFSERGRSTIRIALINNMPDGAFKASERQFQTIIHAALPSLDIQFLRFSSEAVERKPNVEAYIARDYIELMRLDDYEFDAAVITGAEPIAANLQDEPFWLELSAAFDAVARRRIPTLFSCLAAHAAVLHYDAISRVRLEQKRSGVFAQVFSPEHFLASQCHNSAAIPHSRWNTLDCASLRAAGYTMLSHVDDDVDAFTKQIGGLMLFLQGHPEYDADSLQAEYQRDLLFYWAGRRLQPPAIPTSYFDPSHEAELRSLVDAGTGLGPEDACRRLTRVLSTHRPISTWQLSAQMLVGAWLRRALADNLSSTIKLHEFA